MTQRTPALSSRPERTKEPALSEAEGDLLFCRASHERNDAGFVILIRSVAKGICVVFQPTSFR